MPKFKFTNDYYCEDDHLKHYGTIITNILKKIPDAIVSFSNGPNNMPEITIIGSTTTKKEFRKILIDEYFGGEEVMSDDDDEFVDSLIERLKK